METGPRAFKDNSMFLEAWPYHPLGKEELESRHRSTQPGWPEEEVSGPAPPSPTLLDIRKAGAWRCWSCLGQTLSCFHPSGSLGWYFLFSSVSLYQGWSR